MEIGAGMIAGAQHVVDFQFLYVDRRIAQSELPAPLVICAVADDHRVVSIGRWMLELVVPRGILYRSGRCRAKERPSHACMQVILSNLAVAARADSSVDIVVSKSSGGSDGQPAPNACDSAHDHCSAECGSRHESSISRAGRVLIRRLARGKR